MKLIREMTAYYPYFPLGSVPIPVECKLAIVEANGKRYLRTPFAFLDAFADDDIERQFGRGYYRTAQECLDYLSYEYPWHVQARPLMDALTTAKLRSDITGPSRVADKVGVWVDDIHKLARGHRQFSLKQVRAAAKALKAD